MKETPKITVLRNLEEVSRTAARKFVEIAEKEINAKGYFTVALAGGTTPKILYKLLADEKEPFRAQINWQKARFFWSDERCVAPDSTESNFRTAYENLLKPLDVSPSNWFRMSGECEPQTAAEAYENLLRLFFNAPDGVFPSFDLILLGMGADGHTDSVFRREQ